MWWTFSLALAAFPLVSHSDGSAGEIVVGAGSSLEYPLPDDGVVHASRVTVEAGGTLTFTPNVANTPVYLLSTGPILIDGHLDVDGDEVVAPEGSAGGPGGFAGGYNSGSVPGHGAGPFGGQGSSAAFSTRHATQASYRDSLLTLLGGSGGGGSSETSVGACGGTGGAGAVLVASEVSVTVNGSVTARGGVPAPSCTSSAGFGAGGAIRVVAPLVNGSGDLLTENGLGAAGKVRVDTGAPGAAADLRGDSGSPISNIGTTLFVVPPADLPRVRVVSVGGVAVADTGGPAFVTLPVGSASTQTVVVEAIGFGDRRVTVRMRASTGAGFTPLVVLASTHPTTHLGSGSVEFVPSTLTRIDLSAQP